MKILHVIPSVSKIHGGPSYALAMIERALSDGGVSVTTATTDDDGVGRRLTVGVGVDAAVCAERFYARKWFEFYKIAPGLMIWLWRHVRDFDVVHIHALFSFSSVAAALVARLRCVPYVVRPLGTLNVYGVTRRRPRLKALSFALIEKRILANAAAVHFTTREEWDEAKALGISVRGVVIPLGVEDRRPEGKRSTIGGAPWSGKMVVLFLSRLDAKKNVENLLKAFSDVSPRHAGAVLVIAGDGPARYVATLRRLAEAGGVSEKIIWLGHIDGERKLEALAAADVFVLPSFSENFGIAAAEAMQAGLPCLVGHGVAIAGAIAEAGAGLVTDPDADAIARNLDRLLSDETLRRDMGLRGRELCDREYSSKVMAHRLIDLYRSVLNTGNPVAGADTNAGKCMRRPGASTRVSV